MTGVGFLVVERIWQPSDKLHHNDSVAVTVPAGNSTFELQMPAGH